MTLWQRIRPIGRTHWNLRWSKKLVALKPPFWWDHNHPKALQFSQHNVWTNLCLNDLFLCADTYMSLQMYELLGTQCMMTLLLTYCCFTGVRRCTRGQGISWSLYWPPRTCCWAWQCHLPRLTDSPSSGKRRKQIHFSSFFWASVSASFSLILSFWIRSAGL